MNDQKFKVYLAVGFALVINLLILFVVVGLVLLLADFLIARVGLYVATSFFVAPLFLAHTIQLYDEIKEGL